MIREGTKVNWNWAQGEATGTVEEVFHSDVTRTIDGNEVTREASDDTPAYLIEQSDGQKVLKSASEVTRQ